MSDNDNLSVWLNGKAFPTDADFQKLADALQLRPEDLAPEKEDLFLMANLYPRTTGLQMTVWVGPGDHTHAPRIKVNMAHGDRMNPANTAVVGLLPEPHLVEGDLSTQDLEAVSAWAALNREAILDHWNGVTDGAELARALVPLIRKDGH